MPSLCPFAGFCRQALPSALPVVFLMWPDWVPTGGVCGWPFYRIPSDIFSPKLFAAIVYSAFSPALTGLYH